MRKRKIIIVLEPDLLSNEVFAVNPFYDEGEAKNKLQYTDFLIHFRERKGVLEMKACEYSGVFYTTGHTQIHNVNRLFLSKKDRAISEILKSSDDLLFDDGRMRGILKNWNEDVSFKEELSDLIESRRQAIKNKSLKIAMREYEDARAKLQVLMFPDLESKESQ